jgi:dihydropteroate synthase
MAQHREVRQQPLNSEQVVQPATWRCGRFLFEPRKRPLVMGILNTTPDSFSDGGQFQSAKAALAHAERMIESGVVANLLDLAPNPFHCKKSLTASCR